MELSIRNKVDIYIYIYNRRRERERKREIVIAVSVCNIDPRGSTFEWSYRSETRLIYVYLSVLYI